VVYLQHPMKSDVFTTPHQQWCIYNTPWRVMYLQLPMKSDVSTTPHRYITLHGELWIHHSSWGVVNTSLFMGCCKYKWCIYNSPWRVMYLQHPMKSDVSRTPHEEWCIYNTPWRVMYLQHPMKSDVFTTPHEEWCIYNTPWRVMYLPWGVVNTSLFMWSCK
jgi:uncharacterized protein YcgL (UPF0745 family)